MEEVGNRESSLISVPIASIRMTMRNAQTGILCLTDSNSRFRWSLYLEAGEFNLQRQLSVTTVFTERCFELRITLLQGSHSGLHTKPTAR